MPPSETKFLHTDQRAQMKRRSSEVKPLRHWYSSRCSAALTLNDPPALPTAADRYRRSRGSEKTQGHVEASGSNWLVSPLRINPARIRRGLAFTSSIIFAMYSPTSPTAKRLMAPKNSEARSSVVAPRGAISGIHMRKADDDQTQDD